MTIGIIGANGFIGKHLCQKFLDAKMNVIAFYHLQKNQIPNGCKLIQIRTNLNEKLEVLIIAIGNFSQSSAEFEKQTEELKILTQKIDFKRIIYISSTDIYAETNEEIELFSHISIKNNYTKAKFEQEEIIKKFPNYSIIRPTYIYGNGMNIKSLIPTWIKQAKKELQITVFGSGNRAQDYLHVVDFADLCLQVILNFRNHSTILAASGKSISNLELAEIIQKEFINCKLKFIEANEGLSRKFSIEKTKNDYNWNPKITFIEGLKKIIHNENIDF